MMQSSYYDDDDDVRDQLRDALYRMLIQRIRRDRYPSATMMNMVERGLDERRLRLYAEVLLDKIEDDRYPSVDMMKRLEKLL